MLKSDIAVAATLAVLLTKSYLIAAGPVWLGVIIAALLALAITTSFTLPSIKTDGLVGFLILFLFASIGEYLDSSIYGAPKLRYLLSILVYFLIWVWITTGATRERCEGVVIFSLIFFSLQVIAKVWFFAPASTYTSSLETTRQLSLLESPALTFGALFLGKDLFFVNSNEVGFFAVASFFSFLGAGERRKWLSRCVLVICLLLAIGSMSRAALVAGCALLMLILVRQNTGLALLALSLFILFTLSLIVDPAIQISNPLASAESDSERFSLAMYALSSLEQRPWVGGGELYYSVQDIGPHNFFLEAALMFGVIGMVLAFIAISSTLNWGALPVLLLILISLFTHNIVTSPVYLSALFLVGRPWGWRSVGVS